MSAFYIQVLTVLEDCNICFLSCFNRVELLNVFKLERTIEDLCFQTEMGNIQLLMHSSHFHNFLGILSR